MSAKSIKGWVSISETQLESMFRNHFGGDHQGFSSVCTEIAADQARRGNTNLARSLKDLTKPPKQFAMGALPPEGWTTKGKPSDHQIGVFPFLESPDIFIASTKHRLSGLCISHANKQKFGEVIRQFSDIDKLEAHGLTPTRKLLFHGPSGYGKTSASMALAGTLNLPVAIIQFKQLCDDTNLKVRSKLSEVFDEMNARRGVYVFDDIMSHKNGATSEFDLRRVLSIFFDFLETRYNSSIVIATTNAIPFDTSHFCRQFDMIFHFDISSTDDIRKVLEFHLNTYDTSKVDWREIQAFAKRFNFAELAGFAEHIQRKLILDDRKVVETDDIAQAWIEKTWM